MSKAQSAPVCNGIIFMRFVFRRPTTQIASGADGGTFGDALSITAAEKNRTAEHNHDTGCTDVCQEIEIFGNKNYGLNE
jgi:hypothetical protein